jgi:gamma-glutamylcyclotransferase (GGCT)/AIG2-like uncharacterized protein YtfP
MRLFVYGTLRPGADTAMARWLGSRAHEARAATVPGRLIAIKGGTGWFPALVRGRPWERCHGTLIRVALEPGDLARLDRYEGPEYRREARRVHVVGGPAVAATVYRWRGAAPANSLAIPSGDFLSWIAQSGRRSFTVARGGA